MSSQSIRSASREVLIATSIDITCEYTLLTKSMRRRQYAALRIGWRRYHSVADDLLSRDLQLKISKNSKTPAYSSHLADTDAFAPRRPGSDTLFSLLDKGEVDLSDLQLRLKPVSRFLGPSYSLLDYELAAVVCGLANTSVTLGAQDSLLPAGNLPLYNTDSLRILGKKLIRMHLDEHAVFSNERYLACSLDEIESDLSLYDPRKVHEAIPQFMRRNLIYQLVIPFRAASHSGFIKERVQYLLQKEAIHDATCRGSFFTLVGMVHTKYGSDTRSFIENKILGGHRGLITIINKKYLL